MSGILILVLLAARFMLLMLVLPQLFIKRAIPSVIRIFRQHNAVGVRGAKTVDELGLNPKSYMERIGRLRDYKPRALQLLIRADIIQMTEDGKLYLSEENLALTKWNRY